VNFGQSFKLAIKSLMTSKMRALLTMLGIIIGVAAVIIITSLGNGMQNYMNDQFEQMGSNLIQVMLTPGNSSRTVDADDMMELADQNPEYLTGATPYLQPSVIVRHGADKFERTNVYGVSETFYNTSKNSTMQGEELAQGRFLSYIDVERESSVCVIGAYLAQEAFRGDALGKTFTLSGAPFTVVGVLKERANYAEGSGDDVVYISYTQAQRLSSSNSVSAMGITATMYMFTAKNRETSSSAKAIIERRLFKTFQDSDMYLVMTSAEMMDAMDSILNLLMAILTLIAAISLLVGGIGIMNIMLVSVTERTREIGIRKSLGAKQWDIRSQFIIEAGTTSAIGGVIGIVFGIIMANVITNVIALVLGTGNDGFVAVPTASGIGVAFGVSVAIGVLFGFLPANKAASLNPIDALRYD